MQLSNGPFPRRVLCTGAGVRVEALHAAAQGAVAGGGGGPGGGGGGRLCHPVCSLGSRHIPTGTSQAHHLWSTCSEYAFTSHLFAFVHVEHCMIRDTKA